MIKLTQITGSEEICSLTDYYTLFLEPENPVSDQAEHPATELGMVQVSDGETVNRASVLISDAEDGVPEEQVASSLSRLLIGSTVVSEPSVLVFLRELLDRNGQEGEVFFVPLSKLASALFPELPEHSLSTLRDYFALELPEEESSVLRNALLTDAVFRRCKTSISGDEPVASPGVEKSSKTKKKKTPSSRSSTGKKRVSDRKLNQWADRIWTISPWAILAAVAIVVLLIAFLLPKDQNETVDREKAPISYLVLSWDQTGKYGTQPRDKEDPIEFRVPYGVYNVLNNNSIPVELTIVNEDTPAASAQTLSSSGEEEDEAPQNSTVIIRPSMSREIIIDEGQYLTLSEDANELILFYVSAVPEEIASDTTGQVSASQSVVYAYVKGTEVRFRSAPSLEGHIIDTLNNGQQVQVLGITGEWTHVSVQDHKGYIFSEFLTTQDQNSSGS